MNMRLPILSVLFVIFTSACTIPDLTGVGTTPQIGQAGRGLEIITFTLEPSTVFSGTTVRINSEIQNLGGTTVPATKALVLLAGTNLNFSDTSGNSWRSGTSGDSVVKVIDVDMKAEDVVRGIPPNIKRYTWSLIARNLTPGQTVSDTFFLRVYHDYTTAVNGNVWVYSETESEAARASGRTLNKASFTTTSGPVGVAVTVSPDPVVLFGSEDKFTLSIKLSNLAQGTIFRKGAVTYSSVTGPQEINIKTTDLNNVTVSITTTGLTLGSGCNGPQELVAGRDTTLFCEVTINTPPTTFASFPLNINVDYSYFTEKTTTVTVQGR